jgi:N-acetyl-anhydromuramyl-L-alanine amidase AmpD
VGWRTFRSKRYSGPFRAPNPVDVVLHRTDCSFQVVLDTFTTDPHGGSAHFLIGQQPPLLQLVDTRYIAWHVKGLDKKHPLNLGIESESGENTRSDAIANRVPLTKFQKTVGRLIAQRLCHQYNIPTSGPPSRHEMAQGRGATRAS